MAPEKPGQWRLLENWEYFGFTVPEGFVSDLDSVPRIPLVHFRYKGRTVIAAVLHDYLYREQPVSRRMADLLFLVAMEFEGVKWRYQIMIYLAVRLFGGRPWNRNRKQ